MRGLLIMTCKKHSKKEDTNTKKVTFVSGRSVFWIGKSFVVVSHTQRIILLLLLSNWRVW